MTAAFVKVAALRINADDDRFDDVLPTFITAAREYAEFQTERAICEQTLLLQLDEFPADAILLPRPPLIDVDWVKYLDPDGVEQTIDSANYVLDKGQEPGWLLPAADYYWPTTQAVANAVQIQYRAGYSDSSCPAGLKVAIAAAAGWKLEHAMDGGGWPEAIDRLFDPFRIYGA